MKYLQQLSISKIVFWVNAFIPKDIPGVTITVPSGPYRGKTAVPHPISDRSYYLTDQRGFSSDINASSRLHSVGTLFLNGIYPNLVTKPWSDTTVELSSANWEPSCTATAEDWARGKSDWGFIVPWMRITSFDEKLVVIDVGAAASNPCSPPSKIISKIDYHGTVIIDLYELTFSFVGKVDEIPAYEMYVQVDNLNPIEVFKMGLGHERFFGIETDKPKSFLSLTGPANRPVLKTNIRLRNTPYRIDGTLNFGEIFKPGIQFPHIQGLESTNGKY